MDIIWKFTTSYVITAMWIFASYMRSEQPWNHDTGEIFKNKTVVIDSTFIITYPFAISLLSCIGSDKAEKSSWWFLFISVPGPLIMTGSFSTQKEGKLLLLQICSLNQTDAFIQKIFASVCMFFLMYFFRLRWWMHTLKYMQSLNALRESPQNANLTLFEARCSLIFDSEYLDIYPKGTHSNCLLS